MREREMRTHTVIMKQRPGVVMEAYGGGPGATRRGAPGPRNRALEGRTEPRQTGQVRLGRGVAPFRAATEEAVRPVRRLGVCRLAVAKLTESWLTRGVTVRSHCAER